MPETGLCTVRMAQLGLDSIFLSIKKCLFRTIIYICVGSVGKRDSNAVFYIARSWVGGEGHHDLWEASHLS